VKILYVAQYFPPEMGAPAARVDELSHRWAGMGHDVTVLTGFPNHPTGVVPAEWQSRLRGLIYKEVVDGVRVVRTWLWPLPNRKAHERIRNYASFWLSASLSGLGLNKPDVVIGSSPQLLAALAGWWLAWWKRVPFVFEVRDLWPESLAAVGAGDEGGSLHRILGAIAGFLYRRSQHIVVVTPAFKEHLIQHWKVAANKISIVENGVEIDLFRPCPPLVVPGAEGKFVICYIGTMGMAHGLETLIATVEHLRRVLPKALFLMIGEGAEKGRVQELARTRALTNIIFLDQQPRERIPAYIAGSDVCLVLLKKTELFKTVIPTKLLEYMACEKPVIVAVDGQARRMVEEANSGIFVEPDDSNALAGAIVRLETDPDQRRRMGISGRQFILSRLSREQTAATYIRVLEKLQNAQMPR
jgi:colanic acid biosynthesis glycosyl transferase WcaI